MRDNVSGRIEKMNADRDEYVQKQAHERAVLSELPGDLPCPTVSNLGGKLMGDGVSGWLSWRAPFYGEDAPQGSAILASIEAAGWQHEMVTLAAYGNYRASARPGHQNDLPETNGREKLRDTEPVAPLWLSAGEHMDAEASAFYRSPSGNLYRITVPLSRGKLSVSARRVEFAGGWRYERGTQTLRFPQEWHGVLTPDGRSVAGVAKGTAAYMDTDKSVTGVVYFEPNDGQDDFPLTPAGFLALLEG